TGGRGGPALGSCSPGGGLGDPAARRGRGPGAGVRTGPAPAPPAGRARPRLVHHPRRPGPGGPLACRRRPRRPPGDDSGRGRGPQHGRRWGRRWGRPGGGGVRAKPLGYAEAMAEVADILDELDGDEGDVDVLGSRVRRAAELLRLCRERIAGARFEVEQVVAELEAEVEAATDAHQAAPEAPDD